MRSNPSKHPEDLVLRQTVPSLLLRAFSPHGVARKAVEFRLRWAGMKPQVMDLGVARVRVWLGGNGPPLLLLHGFGGDGLWAWHGQIGRLARRHTLIVPDLVWFGGSTSQSSDRSLFFQAETMAALAARLDVERFDLCGVSYGGLVAFTMATMYPDRVRRLVMVDSPGPTYTTQDHEKMLARFGVADVAEIVIPRAPKDVRRLLELAWTHPPPMPPLVLLDPYQKVFSTMVQEKLELLAWLDEQRRNPELRPDWTLPHPTLLVWGEHDPLFPVEVAERLNHSLSQSELVVIPNTRHAPNVEKPGPFNDVLLEFLKR